MSLYIDMNILEATKIVVKNVQSSGKYCLKTIGGYFLATPCTLNLRLYSYCLLVSILIKEIYWHTSVCFLCITFICILVNKLY